MNIIKSLALTACIALGASLQPADGAVINVDIQGDFTGSSGTGIQNYTGSSANGPIESDNTWNYFNPVGVPDAGDSITVSGVTFTLGGTWTGSYADPTGLNHLQGDRIFTQFGNTGELTISGLIDGGKYNIALISAGGTTDYTIGATTLMATAASAGSNLNGALSFTPGGTHVLFNEIEATGGSITIGARQAGGSSFGVLAGLQVQSVAVPEPSLLALLGIGATILLAARRRNVRD